MKPVGERITEVAYSKQNRQIHLLVPAGTKVADLTKALDFLARDVFTKLERGCLSCTSGDHLIIRERLENVIQVDLEQKQIIR